MKETRFKQTERQKQKASRILAKMMKSWKRKCMIFGIERITIKCDYDFRRVQEESFGLAQEDVSQTDS